MIAEVLLILAALPLPLLVGVVLGHAGRPWWWAAIASVAVFMLAAIVPEAEAGAPRVAGDDILFLVVTASLISAFAWFGAFLGRRLVHRRGAAR